MRKALYLLAAISDRDFEWLLSVGKHQAVSAGQDLILEGSPINALYIVLSGIFSVSVEGLGDNELARISTGEVLGEISFIDARSPTATVRAVEDALVWAIPRSQLTAKLSQDVAFSSHFYRAIATFLSDRLRNTLGRLGYNNDFPPEIDKDDALNPTIEGNLELAKVRLDWLLSH
ncbi:MAG: cyclic nucleotide-binding domain-containing protein [Kaiparowitsia implicata GSE-PSE-MK54-09C]|jgi:CRP-like cAMP-binding protein|nr:cyclic nucleotide-binding domain-containing protein [Kaiparowitsia implicata GSE-PSE-MK54-09C]